MAINKKKKSAKSGSVMPVDLLVELFKFMSLRYLLSIASRTSRSWETAAAVRLFCCSEELDLEALDELVDEEEQSQYRRLLAIALNHQPPSQARWQTVLFPRVFLPDGLLPCIASRSPKVDTVFQMPTKDVSLALPYWQLQYCNAILQPISSQSFLMNLKNHCRNLTTLEVEYARVGLQEAWLVVESFPGIRCVRFIRCTTSYEAVCVVLDGCRSLKILDVTHSIEAVSHNLAPSGLRKLQLTKEFVKRAKDMLDKFRTCFGYRCKKCNAVLFHEDED